MEKRSITVGIWTDAWFEDLTAEEKLVWLHLLTHPNSNMLGFFDVSIKRIASDCSMSKEAVQRCLDRFANDKKAIVFDTKIWLCNFIKHQTMNPNMMKNAKNVFMSIPDDMKQDMKKHNLKAFGMVTEAFGMVTEGLGNDSPQEKKREELSKELREEEKKRKENTSALDSAGVSEKKPVDSRIEKAIDKILEIFPSRQFGSETANRNAIRNAYKKLKKNPKLIEDFFNRKGLPEDMRAKYSEPMAFLYKQATVFANKWGEQDPQFCPMPKNWFGRDAHYLNVHFVMRKQNDEH
jgi:hypothetical protein